MAASDRFVELPTESGDLVLPVELLLLALDLEDRGFRLRRDGDDLLVQPFQRLTAEDCRHIRRWKHHLLALVDYQPRSGGRS
jgi:hypothetical protein